MYSFMYTIDMSRTISVKDLRPTLPAVMDLVEKRLERFIVTRRGKPVGVLISVEDYEGLLETIDIMKDPELIKRLKRAEAEAKTGKTRNLDEIRRSLGRA